MSIEEILASQQVYVKRSCPRCHGAYPDRMFCDFCDTFGYRLYSNADLLSEVAWRLGGMVICAACAVGMIWLIHRVAVLIMAVLR